MVMNFDLELNSTTVIITTVVTFYWGKSLLLIFVSHQESHTLEHGVYSQIKYIWNYYTEEEFENYKNISEAAMIYNIYYAFFEASLIVAIVIFEAFELAWQQSEKIGIKLQLREESGVTVLYLLLLRTLFFIIYFPVYIFELKVTRQGLGEFLLWLLLFYFKDLFLILIFTVPSFLLIKYLKQNIIFLIWAVYFTWIIANAAINFNVFVSLKPLEDGFLRRTLEEKILPEIDFSIDDVYYSYDEINEKVYLSDKWIRKTLVITGPLPIDKNVSLISTINDSVQFTTKEVIALILYRIGESSKGYIFSTILSTEVHLFTLLLICWHLYKKEYILQMAGFQRTKPAIANLFVIWYFVIQPYWTFVYYHWKYIYEFTQLTEAQFMVSHFSLQKDLISALVKVYKSNKEFPCHDYWYAILNGLRRPLSTLVLSLAPPNVSYNLSNL